MNEPTNNYEVFCAALRLLPTAVTDNQVSRALGMVEEFTARLTEIEIARPKKEVGRDASVS